MIDLFDLPRSETEKYHVFFENVTGWCSCITIMIKDNSPIAEGSLRTCMAAFVDWPTESPRFSWHDNIKAIPELPFTEEWALEEYKHHQQEAFDKVE